MALNENKNQPKVKKMPIYKGLKVLKVLHISIGEKESFYKCVMEDGTQELVPISLFKEGGE